MDHLQNIHTLKNHYFILRHGESESNTKQVIVGNPEIGTTSYSLTKRGRKQVQASVGNSALTSDTIIYASDFLRTTETAKIAQKIIRAGDIHFNTNLRERYFGDFEGTPVKNYQKVWKQDLLDPDHQTAHVESINQVLDRMTTIIIDLEDKYKNKNILLVSHGDPLQILQTAFLRMPANRQRENYTDLAELLELRLSPQ